MKYERLLNNYNLPIFLRELDKMRDQNIDTEEREEKLRFIRFVSIMFHLKIECLKNPEYRTGEWQEVQYVNLLTFFGSRNIKECEIQLKLLLSKWREIIKKDMSPISKSIELEASLAGEE